MPRRLLPLYVWPGHCEIWDAAIAGLGRGDMVVINPASGAGTGEDPAWVAIVERLRRSGVDVVGYVAVHWGTRPAPDCLDDVFRYAQWYGVQGVFWDEAPSTEPPIGSLARRRLRAWVRSLHAGASGFSVWNPGVGPVPAAWRKATPGAVWCTFEGSAERYLDLLPLVGRRGDEAHLVHSCHRSDVEAVRAHMARTGPVWAHITEAGATGAPWESLSLIHPLPTDELSDLLTRSGTSEPS